MKFASVILCGAFLVICSGCKKEVVQVDRFKVFSATWEDSGIVNNQIMSMPQKRLIKYDSVTGRVWYWNETSFVSTNNNSSVADLWVEMSDKVVNTGR